MPMAEPPKKADYKNVPDYEPKPGLAPHPSVVNKARSTTVKDDRSEEAREFSRQLKDIHWFHANQIMKLAELSISNDRQWQILRVWLLDLLNGEEKALKAAFSKITGR